MKTVKIFLASSINDLKIDRLEVGDFFRHLNEIYLDRNIHFSLIKCEYYDDSISEDGKQTDYDAEICDSDLVFFIFFTKVGAYTRHEFNVALDSYRKKKQPKIITYFKYSNSIDEANEDVKGFMHMLDVELRHYYNTYSNIDTLKLGILMQIKLMQLDNYEIDIKDRKIQLNGNDIANYENIPIFHGNDEITCLRETLDTITEKYYDIHKRHLEDPDDMNIYSDYLNITAERDKVINQLREAEKRVLRLTEKIFSTESHNELSQRQREGYRMLERGDYESALKVLDLNEIYSEIEHNEIIEDNVRKRLQINVNELLQRIETLEAKGLTPVTIAEIKNIYGQACALVQKHNLDKSVLYFYASFLFNQRDYESAINMINLLISQYSNSDEELSER